ncbi:hypothetical protein J2Y49_006323 [Azospirillum sp. BE72]|nr:hypothetical protein [Azospirillum sp. BE72]
MAIELVGLLIFAVFAFNVAKWLYRGVIDGVWSTPIKSTTEPAPDWYSATPENQYIRKTAMYIPSKHDRRH